MSRAPLPLVLSFGKHRGKTYAWVAANDVAYLDWLVTATHVPEVKEAAQKALSAPRRKAREAGYAALARAVAEPAAPRPPVMARSTRYGVRWLDAMLDGFEAEDRAQRSKPGAEDV